MADDGIGKGGGESGGGFGGFGGGLSSSTFSNAGGAAADLFSAKAFTFKGMGAEFEKKNYLLAADLATQNAQFTEASTAIKQMQEMRQIQLVLGGQSADVAGAGFEASGSALDLLRDSAQQGALTRQVAGYQGLITEAGYKEQAESYQNMASAAQVAIDAAGAAKQGAAVSAGLKGAASGASAGAMFGPWGAAAGAVIGGAAGYFGSK